MATLKPDALVLLRQSVAIGSLGEQEQLRIASLLEPVHFDAGQAIVREGDRADRWYLIADGTARVERKDLIGQPVTLAILGAGDSFGESALTSDQPRLATVRAVTNVHAYALDRHDLDQAGDGAADFVARLRQRLDVLAIDTALKRASPFARLPNAAIWSLASQFEPRRLQPGEIVIAEGDEAERFYLVRSGRLEVVRSRRRIARLQAGDSFGEVGLLTGGRRNATVRAIDDAEVLSLPRAAFQRAVSEQPSVADYFRELVSIRYRGAPGQHLLLPDPLATVMPLAGARRRKRYWRVLLVGVVAFAALTALAELGAAGSSAVYLILAVGSLLGPIVFVQYLAESNLLSERPWELAATGALAAALGLPAAILLQRQAGILPGDLWPALLIALVEEPAKVLGVLWIVGRPALRFRMDGVIYGAAAGMGFAAFETGLYAFARVETVGALLATLWLRALLSPFTHGTWTAILCATIWRQRSAGLLRGAPAIGLAFVSVVLLHGLWNWRPLPLPWALVWMLGIGAASILILRGVVQRAVREEASSVVALAPEADHAAPQRRGIHCQGCGRLAPAGAHYCPRCGRALARARA